MYSVAGTKYLACVTHLILKPKRLYYFQWPDKETEAKVVGQGCTAVTSHGVMIQTLGPPPNLSFIQKEVVSLQGEHRSWWDPWLKIPDSMNLENSIKPDSPDFCESPGNEFNWIKSDHTPWKILHALLLAISKLFPPLAGGSLHSWSPGLSPPLQLLSSTLCLRSSNSEKDLL